MDLKQSLNPTTLMEEFFLCKNLWIGFLEFYKEYRDRFRDELRRLHEGRYRHLREGDFYRNLEARLYRTYLGILTEYHAYFLAGEVFGAESVKRGSQLDKIGVDFQILYGDDVYNMHILVDTPRAWEYRLRKWVEKESDKTCGIHVNFPYTMCESTSKISRSKRLSNGFFVYTKEYMEYLRAEITSGSLRQKYSEGLVVIGTDDKGFVYGRPSESPHYRS